MKAIFYSLLCALAAAAFPARAQTSALVSSAPRPSATGGGGSYQPILSPDGRFVAFVSQANNLVVNDNPAPNMDVFLRDRIAGTIMLVSVRTNSVGGGDDNSVGPSISADGRFVAFQSAAGNLTPDDTNGLSDVFLRDMVAGTTVLVSRELSGRSAADRASASPIISTNGRFVVFESAATNLVANDTNNSTDVFLFDRETGSNSLVSLNAAGNGSRATASFQPAFTPDGSRVAYVSTNGTFGSNQASHVFVRDLQNGTTIWASSNALVQLPGLRGVLNPVFSADGSAVFFHAFRVNQTNLFRFNLTSGGISNALTLIGVSANASSVAAPSQDGRFVAFDATNRVFVVDLQSGNRFMVSVDTFGVPAPSTAGPARPAISADGTKVLFLSNARDLTAEPTNGLAQLYLRDVTAGSTVLLSGDSSGATSGDLGAVVPVMSANGNVVAFESTSSTMIPDDLNLASDVFIRDVAAGTTALVSGRDGQLPSASSPARVSVFPNSISSDGRFVAFGSLDNGLFAGDTNGVQDIFVRGLVNGTVEPASVSSSGAFTNTMHSLNCVLSRNGRHVAYVQSRSSTLPGASAIFWRDLESGETRGVSDPAGSLGWQESVSPTISADGHWVAFQTSKPASLFEPGIIDANSGSDIILHDALVGTNFVVSRNTNSSQAATDFGISTAPVLSRDGRWLAYFNSELGTSLSGYSLFVWDLQSNVRTLVNQALPMSAGNRIREVDATFSSDSKQLAFTFVETFLPPDRNNQVFVYDLLNQTGAVACVACRRPSVSADARFVVAETRNSFSYSSVVLYDRQSDVTNLIGGVEFNTQAVPPRFEFSSSPVIGGDARFVVFAKRVSKTESWDANGWPSLFVHDRVRAVTLALAPGVFSSAGNGPSYTPVMADNGRTVVFASFASDLIGLDYNNRRDVFTVRLGRPDGDGDGLDDDWEETFFSNLARDGNGDFDHDGQSDRQEFLSGTDPTNTGSVLRAVTVMPLSATFARVFWEAVPGRNYQVQYKDNVGEEWKTLPGQVTATSGTASMVDSGDPLPAQRLYRVVLSH